MFFMIIIVNKSYEKTEIINELILAACVVRALYGLFLCAIELYCCTRWFLHYNGNSELYAGTIPNNQTSQSVTEIHPQQNYLGFF